MSFLGRLLARLALAGFGLGVALVAIELAVRLWPLPATDLRGLHEVRPDRAWVFGLRPGAHQPIAGTDGEYRVNADGFRDRDVLVPKPAGTFRIALVGDSLTFGYAVRDADTMPRQLERALTGPAGGPAIEVLNLGVSGYNPYTEAALFADVGPRYAPDLVLVQFCVNDLNDPTLHFDFSTRAALPPLPDIAFPDPSLRAPPPSRWERACAASRACTLVRARLLPPADELRRAFDAVGIHATPNAAEIAWVGDRYADIARTAQQLGARFGVVVFPYESQLEANAPSGVQSALLGLGATRGWPTFDLLPPLRAAHATRPDRLYVDLWHPTGPGYAIAADALARELRCAGLVPRPALDGDCTH